MLSTSFREVSCRVSSPRFTTPLVFIKVSSKVALCELCVFWASLSRGQGVVFGVSTHHVVACGSQVMLYTLSSSFQSHVISMAGNFNKVCGCPS